MLLIKSQDNPNHKNAQTNIVSNLSKDISYKYQKLIAQSTFTTSD